MATFHSVMLYNVLDILTSSNIDSTVNPERIASVIFNDFINPATLTSLYDNECNTCFTCACAKRSTLTTTNFNELRADVKLVMINGTLYFLGIQYSLLSHALFMRPARAHTHSS